jgi:hypothetical protein
MTREDLNRFYFNLTVRHAGHAIPEGELVDADAFFGSPDPD